MSEPQTEKPKNPFREIVQPFIDVVRAPRALWGINLPYLLEGMVYFGILSYLAIYFSDTVFAGLPEADIYSHYMVMVLTAGITIAMFFLGFVADKFGVRNALLMALGTMLVGRLIISGAPALGWENGLWGGVHVATFFGIVLVVIGYGMYQPAAYAGVRQFTTPKTAAMGFAMLYALMNLGGYLPTFAFFVREEEYLGWGIIGGFWVYTFFTVVALVFTFFVLSKRVMKSAIEKARKVREEMGEEEKAEQERAREATTVAYKERIPVHLWVFMAIMAALFALIPFAWLRYSLWAICLAALVTTLLLPEQKRKKVYLWVANHPLSDAKFFFFIFALIPVQTLFAYNWLIIPQYVSRVYTGWIGDKFEIAANFNPILVFIFVPIVTALTYKRRVYNMMIWGTLIMAVPAFLLAFASHINPVAEGVLSPILVGLSDWLKSLNAWAWMPGTLDWMVDTLAAGAFCLFGYLLIMTIGEAMWQPRFLQYAAQIAPEGRTGEYMGVAQLPWFLTKMLVPALYSGWMIQKYCPAEGPQDPETMWLWFSFIAIASPILLVIFKPWAGKGFKESV